MIVGVPLTALHADWGSLDATCHDLGGARDWEQIYKVLPRAPLTCRGCGRGMHAKVSKLGLRFFAHDAAVLSTCPHTGETPAQRLLTSELAAAQRRVAGWTVELEVTGPGWHADVLGSSPDGRRRVAWQAQLASATLDELVVRTTAMLADLDAVCWVSDKDTTWIAHVPSARIRRDAASAWLMVLDGVARFEPGWCRDHQRCDQAEDAFAGRLVPCSGHGYWQSPPDLSLDVFVAAVCAGTVGVHRASVWRLSASSRHRGAGTTIWTAARYVGQERAQLDAVEGLEGRRRRQEEEEARHRRRIEALTQRQQALVKPTVDLVYREAGTDVSVPKGRGDPRWAMGVPVSVPAGPYAVICPVASRVDAKVRSRLASLLIVVADEHECARVAATCSSGQRIVILTA